MTLTFFGLIFVGLVAFYVVKLIGQALTPFVSRSIVAEAKIDSFTIGFFTLIMILSIESIFIPEDYVFSAIMATIALVIAVSLVFVFWKRQWKWLIPSNFELVLVLVLILLWVSGNAYIRYHASPDIHGLAASTGWFGNNLSFQHLQYEFMRFTGAERPEMYGQATKDLISTWNIPDARLRFAADHILTVGRIGTALQLALIGQFIGQSISFPFFMISLGAIGIWITSVYSVQAFWGYFKFLNPGFEPNNSRKVLYLSVVFFILSPMAILMILEGALPQILTFAAISWALAYGISLVNNNRSLTQASKAELFLQGLAPLFIACIYPQGLLIVFPIIALPWLIDLVNNKQRSLPSYLRGILLTVTSFLPAVLVTYVVNQYTFVRLATEFLTLSTGSPYNPGYITLLSSIFQVNSELEYQSVTGPGGGFASQDTSSETALFQLIALLLVFLSCLIYSLFSYGRKNRAIRIILFVVSLALMWSAMRLLLLENPVSTYFYARAIQTFLVVGLPLFLAISLSPRIFTGSQITKRVLFALFLIFAVFQAYGSFNAMVNFAKSSEEFNLDIEEKYFDINPNSSIVISENPDHKIFALTLSGPLFYFTDTWNPRLYSNDVENPEFNVIYVDLSSKPAAVTKIGTLTLPDKLDGPIFLSDLNGLPGFKGNSNYYILLQGN